MNTLSVAAAIRGFGQRVINHRCSLCDKYTLFLLGAKATAPVVCASCDVTPAEAKEWGV